MANTEDMEAKLAAYVDGEIDAAGRAQIEQHLAANPPLRQLIDELVRQRKLMQALPRESAPAEVAEAIHTQLERAVLLGDMDDEVQAARLRIGHWPQIRAVAAVLLLMVSLAALIYSLLPPAGTKPAEIADLRMLPPLPEIDEPATTEIARLETPADVERFSKAGAAGGETEQAERAKLALADQYSPKSAMTNVGDAGEQMFRQVLKGEGEYLQAKDKAREMVVVIPTRDLDDTNREVRQYLSRNNISWDSQPQAMPPPLVYGAQQSVWAARSQSTAVQLKQGFAMAPTSAPADGADNLGQVWQPDAAPAQEGLVQQQAIEPLVAAAPATQEAEQIVAHPQPLEQRIVARQVPRQQAMQLELDLGNLRARRAADAFADVQRPAEDATAGLRLLSEEPLRVHQNIPTTMSVEEAMADVTQAPVEDVTKKMPLATSADAATTMPAAPAAMPPQRIAAGDVLRIRVPQLVGPGIEPESTQTISTAGTASLPMLDPFPVTGLTEDELEGLIARKYYEAHLIPDATVMADIDSSASTQPAAQAVQELQQQQVAQAILGTPTTQPLEQDLVDVVIVLQKEAPVEADVSAAVQRSATQPTSQPAPSTTAPAEAPPAEVP